MDKFYKEIQYLRSIIAGKNDQIRKLTNTISFMVDDFSIVKNKISWLTESVGGHLMTHLNTECKIIA